MVVMVGNWRERSGCGKSFLQMLVKSSETVNGKIKPPVSGYDEKSGKDPTSSDLLLYVHSVKLLAQFSLL